MQRLSVSCLAATDDNSFHRQNKKLHLSKKETLTHQNTAKQNLPTPVRPLVEIRDYEPQIFGPQNPQDPHWKDHLYDEEKLEFKHN